MARYEPKHVQKPERAGRKKKLNENRRGRMLLALLFAVCALLPAIQFAITSALQLKDYAELATDKSERYAAYAADAVEAVDMKSGEAAAIIEDRLNSFFTDYDCSAGDSVKWSVYTLDGTEAALVAGCAEASPAQREILAARSSGICVTKGTQKVSAAAIILSENKVLGVAHVEVDYSTFGMSVHRSAICALISLGIALAVYCITYILLGLIPAFRTGFPRHGDVPERFGDVFRRYFPRALIVTAVIAAVCLSGTWQIAGTGQRIYEEEREELSYRCAEYDLTSDPGKSAGNELIEAADFNADLAVTLLLTALLSVTGGTIYILCTSAFDRSMAEEKEEEKTAYDAGDVRTAISAGSIRLFLSALAGVIILLGASALFLGLQRGGTVAPAPTDSAAAASRSVVVSGKSEPANSLESVAPVGLLPDTASDTDCRVILNYSSAPDGTAKEYELANAAAGQILSLTPQVAPGYAFYWLRDEKIWNGTDCYNGMLLKGVWIPVYDVTVY